MSLILHGNLDTAEQQRDSFGMLTDKDWLTGQKDAGEGEERQGKVPSSWRLYAVVRGVPIMQRHIHKPVCVIYVSKGYITPTQTLCQTKTGATPYSLVVLSLPT